MRLWLTDNQVCTLGFDSPTSDRPKFLKQQSGYWLFECTSDDIETIRTIADTLAYGSDPSIERSARGILKKLDKLA